MEAVLKYLILLCALSVLAASAQDSTNEIYLAPGQSTKATRVRRGTNEVAVRFLNSTNQVRPFVLYRKNGANWQAFQTNAVVGRQVRPEQAASTVIAPTGPKPSDRFAKPTP